MPDPAIYTHGHHASVLRSHTRRTVDNSAAYLVGDLQGPLTVLDVGCGPGSISIDMARRLPDGQVTAVDVAPEILRTAAAAAGGLGNITFRQADVAHLPFADRSFDLVHAHQVLQHLGDPVHALAEMRRVCRHGGLVAARDSDYGAMVWHPDDHALERWRGLYRAVARANGADPDAGRRLRGWALHAGFTEVTATASAWCWATDSDRHWWADLWAERLTQTRVGQRAIELGLADRAELAELASALRQWAAAPDGVFIVPHGEIRCRM